MMNGTPVWQIDGNFGLTSGVAEMLVQSQSGYTQFLPAIPSAWEEGSVQGLKARGNFTIGEKWANGVAETFTVCYDGDKESSTFTGSYEDITSAKVYADGKEIEVTKEEETGRISFEAKAGKTYTIDMSETNVEELKEKATAFLKQLHPDLIKIKEELQSAIDRSSKELGSILTKAKQMDQLYRTYLQEAENVYYLTDQEGLAYNEIDTIYNQLRELRNTLLENTGDMEYYQKAESQLTDTAAQLEKQMENRVISFSKDSGIIGEDRTLTLSKSENAKNYEIRYTTDGSVPRKTSENYEKPLQLSNQEDTVVRAALFYKEQRVSPVYTKKYMTEGISVKDLVVSHENHWGDTYAKEKMIDGNPATRWASKGVDTSKPMELTLTFAKAEPLSQMKFDLFVSRNNAIGAFEIQALVDGTYQTVYEGTKMGDINDKVGDVDGNSEGYHAYYLAEFPEINTDSVKVILKAGFLGEPSLYEVTPLCAGVPADKAGDAAELESMIGLAEEADRTSDYYVNAPQELKDAFEESISDGKEMLKASQDLMDSRTEFLSNRYDRLGFGETDKSALETLIARAEEALKGEYTNESLYQLKKVLAEAKEVLADESAKQPTVDQTAQKLQKALGNLEQDGFEEIQVPASELQGSGKWIQAGDFKATADDNAGALTYEFSGHSIQVPTVKGNDHGVIRVTIQEQSGKQVYREEIDTYAAERAEGVELMQAEFSEGTYTIQFERVGKSSQAPNTKGWVEVGALTIRKEKKETVDRSRLEEELKICEGLNEKEYTTESWTALQEVVKSATELLAKPDEETCTSEMNDKVAEVEAARENLQKVTVDISELKEVIKTAKAISSEGYTKESFEALQQGIREAEVLLNGTYTQDEVNEKTAILKQRISGLRADKTALQEKYDKIKDMTQGQATDESWKEFTGLREQAKNVLDNPNATPNEVSEILEKLNKFEFTYKDKESGEEDKKDPNPGTSGDSEQQGTSDTSHKKESVKTGDTTAIAVPVAGIVGVAVLLYVMRKRRKIES